MSSSAARRSSSAWADESGTPAASPSTMATTSLPDHATSTRRVRRLVVTRTSPRNTAAGGPSNRMAVTRWSPSRAATWRAAAPDSLSMWSTSGRARRDQPVVEREGRRAHGRVAGKRASACAGEKQQAGVGVRAVTLGEYHAHHAGVATRLARQQQAHIGRGVLEAEPPLGHRFADDSGQPRGDQANRGAADVGVEGRDTHGMIIRTCASSTAITSCCRCHRTTRSRWRSTG